MKFLLVLALLASGQYLRASEGGKLTVYVGGRAFGSETYSIENSDGQLRLTGSGKDGLGSLKIGISEFTVVMDEQYQPLSARADGSVGKVHVQVDTKFADGKATARIESSQGPQTVETSVHPSDVVLNSNLPLFPWVIIAMRAKLDTSEPQKIFAYIIGQSEVPVTVTNKGMEQVEFANRKEQLHHLEVSFTPGASGQPVQADFWITGDRRLIKIVVPKQKVEAYQVGYMPRIVAPKPAGATLAGKVVDTSGKAVTGAWVTVKDPATGDTDYVLTDERGQYRLGPVPPGSYTLEISMQGYQPFQQTGISLKPGTSLDILLSPAPPPAPASNPPAPNAPASNAPASN